MTKLNKILPHGNIEKIFENIWYVKGQVKMPMLLPMKISKTMTIIKNPLNNELTLLNAMPLNLEGLKQLESIGKITNTLRIGGYHGRDDNFYKEKFNTKAYALKGQVYAKKFEKAVEHPDNGYFKADVIIENESDLPFDNASLKFFETSHPPEAILKLNQDGGILFTADSLQNTAKPDEFCNFFARKMMGKMGFFKAYNVGPGWVQFAKPSLEEIRSILDLEFESLVPGHGDAVIGNAKEKYRPTLEGEIKGCH